MASTGPRLAAHRGGAALWPENSLLAFRRALALGIPLLELDVHPTRDGDVAVVHDTTLDRTTDGAGPVTAHGAAQLRERRLRGPDGRLTDERLPMLAEVLAVVAPTDALVLVEMKGPTLGVRYERQAGVVRLVGEPRYDGLEERVLATLDAAGMRERANLMAFNPDVLARLRALAPTQRLTLLVARGHVAHVGARPEDAVRWARDAGATDVGVEHTLVDAGLIAQARAAGIAVGAWTVNDEPTLRRLAGLGVDVLTTDRPDLARRVLAGG
jgi:glycerophosphoryl diester phosphodiesterase